jgi:carboxyl-terminal processing protease
MHPEKPQAPIQNSRSVVRLPMIIGITLAAGVLLGSTFFSSGKKLSDVAKY